MPESPFMDNQGPNATLNPHPNTTVGRTVLALFVFFGLVVAAALFLIARVGQNHITNGPLKENESEESTPQRLFYRSIGHAPMEMGHSLASTGLEPGTSYTLEIQVTDNRQQAEKLVDALAARGVEAYFTPLSRRGKVVYRIRRGLYAGRDEALKAAQALRRDKKVGTKVVRLQ